MQAISVVVVALLVVGSVSAWTLEELSPLINLKSEFELFKTKYGRNYSSLVEERRRFDIFTANLVEAMNLNAAEEADGATYGVTKFMDMSATEFKQRYLGYTPTADAALRAAPLEAVGASEYVASPCTATSCDWRKAGAVSPVKNQGQCGSCWAFSATEGLESGYFLAGHTLPILAPQQLVSCDKVDGGCNGGDLPTAYKYITSAGGLESEKEYPYTSGGGKDGTCKFNAKDIVASMSGWSYAVKPCYDACTGQDESALKTALAATGPSSICVNAEPWQFYTKGIMKTGCPGAYTQLDHCVQLIGYDQQGSVPYWIVKNSWAADWGVAGYIYIQIGKNLCGVADEATFVKGS